MTKKDKHPKPESDSIMEGADPTLVDESTRELSIDSISAEELDALKNKAAKSDENWDKFLRLTADFDNYRKRVAREKEELARYTSEKVVSSLLPTLDNLERAIDAAQTHGQENSAILEGITQVYNQFRRTLTEFGLQEIATESGQPFDPNLHEAVSQAASDEHP